MEITQFQGEDRHEAIVNHFSMDIQEEEDFFKWINAMGYSEEDPDDVIEDLVQRFRIILD